MRSYNLPANPHSLVNYDAAVVPEATEVAITSSTPRQSRIFELPIELGQPNELLERIVGWVGSDGSTKRVMYVNAHVLNQSREDATLRGALEEADLVYCDGYGVRLAAKALSADIPHRMTGADWIWDLATLCEAEDRSLYLLGCEPGVARQAGQRLRRAHPKLRIVGTHHGYFEIGSGHDERVIEDINARQPDILLVGMGTPKQEIWAQRTVDRLDCSVLWGVGALFDFVSGRVPRAPASLSDNGLEWIFRLAIEPKRMWRRYLVGNPVFLSRVMAQARQRHSASR
ncbi:MAG: N-acetylglucosaminyldiphosphoundecaprenol N-acetyl-beta-D-mannosaminyltransferase [Solirubrobacteraceae bacterium]|nr:N-acetylglucosaminyldiphosphoundecaprenol N-acetyl-beta-D-mannosaminyltransferase [Solirubrobacteraceae bacterium]